MSDLAQQIAVQRVLASAPVPSVPRCPACGSAACPGTRSTCLELVR